MSDFNTYAIYGVNQNVLGTRSRNVKSDEVKPYARNFLLLVEETFLGNITDADFALLPSGQYRADKTVFYVDQGKNTVPFGYGAIKGTFAGPVGGFQPMPITVQLLGLIEVQLTFFLKSFSISIVLDGLPSTYNYVVYLWGEPQLIN